MAIHIEAQNDVQGGFKKTIEESALGMMLDVMQKYQYQYPIKSAVRELVSNGLDAISERNMARNILLGKNVVSDYFADIEGDIYMDSRFDPNYYNLKYLGDEEEVKLIYHEGNGTEKDYVKFIDQGVGLGGKRLEKYFNLGYSTKRLNKISLGKFGLGNKSPLAIMPYYTMQNVYNGKLFRFNIYSGTINSLIPKFNLETGKLNGVYVCETLKDHTGKPIEFYYEETRQLNGITIIIEAKKHHRTSYLDAVKSQLLYFDNINMTIERESGYVDTINYKAPIFYEDDQIILSDNNYWSRPHLLINRVNYGFIDFDELELEHKSGNIGIKVNPEDVSINPSRESVLWDDVTKNMVLQKFKDVIVTATRLVQEELKEVDFIKWLRVCYQISARYQGSSSNTVVSRLANIIDISQVKPTFTGEPRIRFSPDKITKGLHCRCITSIKTRRANITTIKINRDELKYGIGSVVHLPLVLKTSVTNVRKDKYMLKHLYTDGFVTISLPSVDDEEYADNKQFERTELVWEQFNKSVDSIIYEDIVVPDDFKATDKDEEEEIITEADQKNAQEIFMTHEERRKHTGEIVVHTVRVTYGNIEPRNQWSEWCKVEVPLKSVNTWDEEEIYYGNDADAGLLVFAAFLCRPNARNIHQFRSDPYLRKIYNAEGLLDNDAHRSNTFVDRKDIKIFKTSISNNQHFKDFKPIREFFLNYKNNVITMSNLLVKWNTARLIKNRLHELDFLFNFTFNPDRQKQGKKMRDYVDLNYKEIEDHMSRGLQHLTKDVYTSLISHMEKVKYFQMFVDSCDDADKISELAKEMWKNPSVTDGQAIDMELWKEFEELLDWASSIQILNEMPVLTGLDPASRSASKFYDTFEGRDKFTMYSETEEAINSFLESKGVY